MLVRAGSTDGVVAMEAYDRPLEDLRLSVRTYNCLKRIGLQTVGDILRLTPGQLWQVRNLSYTSFAELHSQLIAYGFMSAFEPIGPFVDGHPSDA